MDNSTDVERAIKGIIKQTVSTFIVSSSLRIMLHQFYSVSAAVVRVFIPDWALCSLWIHLWRDAPESQCPDWKTGRMNLYWQGQLHTLSCVNSTVLSTRSLFSLRIFVPTQRAGPRWARSRWPQPTSDLPVKPPARSRGWSVNQHSSLILTVLKALPSKPANPNLLLYFYALTSVIMT